MTKIEIYGIYVNYHKYHKSTSYSRNFFKKNGLAIFHRKPMMAETRKNNPDNMISAKEIVKSYNISYQTVNHYTDFGLLEVQAKKGNVRFYDRELVDKRLREIAVLTEEGYSLRLIRRKLIGI